MVNDGVGVSEEEFKGVGVGVIKIIFMELSSGNGETRDFLDIRTPMTRTTNSTIPKITVTIAIILLRSSMVFSI